MTEFTEDDSPGEPDTPWEPLDERSENERTLFALGEREPIDSEGESEEEWKGKRLRGT